MKHVVDGRGNYRQVIERWAVIIAGIVMVIAGAEQVDQKQAVNAFIVVQGFLREQNQPQQSRRQQNDQAAPPPAVA